eukprot:g28526.t1
MLHVRIFWALWAAAVEKPLSQLCVLSPESLREALADRDPPGCIEGATATFAAPAPEQRIWGVLHWTRHGCEANATGVGPVGPDGAPPRLHLARRGRCSFAAKSAAAARRGAVGLVVADFEASEEMDTKVAETLVAGTQGQLSLIPTLLIGQRAAWPLVNATTAGDVVEVEVVWGRGRPLPLVLDVWLPANSWSSSLLRELAPALRDLDEAVRIQPHWRVVPFEEATSTALARHCARALPQLCAAAGDAADLEEVVRHHCLLRGHPKLWWHYVESGCHGTTCGSGKKTETDESWYCAIFSMQELPPEGLPVWKLLGLCLLAALLGRSARQLLLALLRRCKTQKRA